MNNYHVLLALVDVDEDNVDDGGGNLSHEENFFCICLLIWNDSSEKNTIKAVLLNNFSC